MSKAQKRKEGNVIMDIIKGALSGLGGSCSTISLDLILTSGIGGLGIGAMITAALPVIGGAIMFAVKGAILAGIGAAGNKTTGTKQSRLFTSRSRGQGTTQVKAHPL